MGQRDWVNNLLLKSEARKRQSEAIQAAYEKYYASRSDADFGILIKELDSYCISWVRKQLWRTGCYTDEKEENTLQESRIAVWELVEKDRKASACRQNFSYYAFGVYKYKTWDEIRKVIANRNKWNSVSIHEPMDDSGRTYEDKIVSAEFDDGAARDEQRVLFDRMFLLYCHSFLESSAFPPRLLALYYARVLPHLLGKIPDSKKASAKWAYEYMEGQTIGCLKADSEGYLCSMVDKTLQWGGEFCRKLQEEAELGKKVKLQKKPVILKDVVYTEVYDKGKIEDWADYMHKVAAKTFMYMLLEDAELLELADEYITHDDTLYRYIRKGGDK